MTRSSITPSQTKTREKFRIITEGKLDSTFNVVVSERSDGLYSIALYHDVYHVEIKAWKRFFVANATVVDEAGMLRFKEVLETALSEIKVLLTDEEARETNQKQKQKQ